MMIVQYVMVALAVLVSLAWLGRNLLSTWKAGGCGTGGGCSGCGHNQGGSCASPDQRLVQLKRRR